MTVSLCLENTMAQVFMLNMSCEIIHQSLIKPNMINTTRAESDLHSSTLGTWIRLGAMSRYGRQFNNTVFQKTANNMTETGDWLGKWWYTIDLIIFLIHNRYSLQSKSQFCPRWEVKRSKTKHSGPCELCYLEFVQVTSL